MRKSQQGFTVVEGLLIVLILSVLGFAGYYVMTQNKKDKTADATSTIEKSKDSSTPASSVKDETEDWYEYQPANKEYTIKLPDGWELQYGENTTSLYGFSYESITYVAGEKAKVTLVGGRDWGAIPFLLNYSATGSVVFDVVGTKQSSFKTNSGLTVDKYYNLVTSDPETMGPPKDTKQYSYEVKKGTSVVVVQHDIVPDGTDQTAIIEKVIKTIIL